MKQTSSNSKMVITDGSRLMIEAMVRAGADAFIGYPITPANLLYSYSAHRMPMMLPAPDEITTLQWMTGLSTAGMLPVTATSFPGYALMLESINMAFMMEMPMVIILVQRLGPATGTATCGAQGDIALLRGQISGGHQLPVLCVSDYRDCWKISAEAVKLAERLRTPVVLLTSKEGVMTQRSFDFSVLEDIKPIEKKRYTKAEPYQPYLADSSLVPEFLEVGNTRHQVRINASTHDAKGILQHSSPESLANTIRLENKAVHHLPSYTFYELDEQAGAKKLVVAFDISASAAIDAVEMMRSKGEKVSLLIPQTLFPIPDVYYNIMDKYEKVVMVEENINAQYARIMFGHRLPSKIATVGSLGKMITPQEIINGGE
jgi:2-oxoglutarate/2-oxoacid ferredoxin oxidoreductase subunit alpha